MQKIVIDICEKFHNDRLRNNRALVFWKSDNNNPKKKHNNNALGPVSGSIKIELVDMLSCLCQKRQLINNRYYTVYRTKKSNSPKVYFLC